MSTRVTTLALATLLALSGTAFGQLKVKEPETPKADPKAPAETVPATKIQPGPGKQDKPTATKLHTLNVGDSAPALSIDSWIKGDAVKAFEPGKVYVVEFWATWCGPCRESIPHLSEVQKTYKKDITVIGVAASEATPKVGESDNRVMNLKSFVAKQGAKMDYRVAYDSKRAMSKAWMEAAGQDGIPCAFIVGKDSKIAWIGHPMDDQFSPSLEKAIKAAGPAKPEEPKTAKPTPKPAAPKDDAPEKKK